MPLLEKRLSELLQIQQERRQIFEERRRVGRGNSGDETARRTLFHAVVAKEDALTSRQLGLFQTVVSEVPEMRKQIAVRRDAISSRVAELRAVLPPASADDDDQTSSAERTESRNLGRFVRMYYILDQRLSSLPNSPRAPVEWPRPLLQALFSPDADPNDNSNTPELLRRRLQQLRQDQEELRRRMNRLDRQIDEVADRLEEIDPAGEMLPPN